MDQNSAHPRKKEINKQHARVAESMVSKQINEQTCEKKQSELQGNFFL
jgi:hypothetical protein